MWTLKNKYNRNRFTDTGNKLVVVREEGDGGMDKISKED